jgi:phenylacetic acid degradation operon negative regulatory protein
MPSKSLSVASQLVARFLRQKPLRAGSLIVTLFGDAIMPRGGAISLGSLIALAAPFGINERLVRTATARLAQEDWLLSRRVGKLSEYALSDDGRKRFQEATKRIYSAADTPWSERWTLVVLPHMKAAQKDRLRTELTWLGFGELSSGTFAHPEMDHGEIAELLRSSDPHSPVIVFDAVLIEDEPLHPRNSHRHTPKAHDASHRLIDLGWNLDELGARYQRFVDRFEGIRAALSGRLPAPRECFIVRTLLIHEYRRLHLRDPLLPAKLLRADWPGTQAAQLCHDIYARVFAPSERHLTEVGARLTGPLPPPDTSVLERFGGIQYPGGERKV